MMVHSLVQVVCAVVYTLLAVWLLLVLADLGPWLLALGLAVLVVVISTKRLWAATLLGVWLGLR